MIKKSYRFRLRFSRSSAQGWHVVKYQSVSVICRLPSLPQFSHVLLASSSAHSTALDIGPPSPSVGPYTRSSPYFSLICSNAHCVALGSVRSSTSIAFVMRTHISRTIGYQPGPTAGPYHMGEVGIVCLQKRWGNSA
ncbi:hypothetical protein AA313_de0204042 [Arthrobotrys entomopaga]|nr:hypothetical protein AA313_de0204042 [Arthrobotrys entomopaga]